MKRKRTEKVLGRNSSKVVHDKDGQKEIEKMAIYNCYFLFIKNKNKRKLETTITKLDNLD